MKTFVVRALAPFAIALSAHADLPHPVSGDFYVSDWDNDRIAVYKPDGSFSHSFTAAGLSGPRGIVFAPNGRVFVSSQNSSEVFAFDQDENFLFKFDDPGLIQPTGLAVSPGGDLYAASFGGGSVCVFNLNGGFLRAFSAPGFNTPNCVMFDSAGNIYASSASNARVYKWNAAEVFQTSFTHPTSGSLSSPMGIARDGADVLYVAGGGSDNIVKFATDGSYLGEITHPDLTGPQGVAFDDRGHMFSPSFFDDRIVEFDDTETYVQTITAGGLDTPRTVAFLPAVAQFRNDAGDTNAAVFSSTSLPLLGAAWTSEIDASSHVGATLTFVLGHEAPLEFPINLGVILIDITTPQNLYLVAPSGGGVASHSVNVTNDLGLLGVLLYTQGVIIGGGAELTNAIDLELGSY